MNERDPQDARDPHDVLAEKEAEAAAREAGSIGGRAPENDDPAWRPVEESGGGVAEGFEQAEADLIENAEHGSPGARDPSLDAFPPDAESDRTGVEYGEADNARTEDRPDQS